MNRISDSSTVCVFVVTQEQFSVLKQSEGNFAVLFDKTKPVQLAELFMFVLVMRKSGCIQVSF